MLELPRRNCVYKFTPAEKAIWDAVQAVENAGCDVRLTKAVILLEDALAWVADFVDSVPEEAHYPKHYCPHCRQCLDPTKGPTEYK